MKIVVDSRGIIESDASLPNTLAVNVPATFNSPITLNGGFASAPPPQQIYVNTTGSDTNPGTAQLPVQTLAGAFALVSPSSHIQIFFASGSYTVPGGTEYRLRSVAGVTSSADVGGFLPIYGFEFIGGYDVVATGTISGHTGTGPNRVYWNDTTKTWTPHQYDGMTFSTTIGSVIDDYQIIETTVSGVSINAWSNAANPVSASTYEIRKPNVNLILSGTSFGNYSSIQGGTVSFKRLVFSGSGAEVVMFNNSIVNFAEVQGNNLAGLYFYNCYVDGSGSVEAPTVYFNSCSLNFNKTTIGVRNQPKLYGKNAVVALNLGSMMYRTSMYLLNDTNVSRFNQFYLQENSHANMYALIVTGSMSAMEVVSIGNENPVETPSSVNVFLQSNAVEKTQICNTGTGPGIAINNGGSFRFNGGATITAAGASPAVQVLTGSQFTRTVAVVAAGSSPFFMSASNGGNDIQIGNTLISSGTFVTSGSVLNLNSLSFALIA
jgi:hypothetical protein